MDERRNQELAALKKTRDIMNELSAAQNEVREAEKQVTASNAEPVRIAQSSEEDIRRNMQYEIQSYVRTHRNPSPFLLLAILAAVAAVAVMILLEEPLSRLGLYGGIGLAVIFAILHAVMTAKYTAAGDEAIAQIQASYAAQVMDAQRRDEAEKKRMEDFKNKKLSGLRAAVQEKQRRVQELETELDAVCPISREDIDEDPELLRKMIRLMESHRADSIKECFAMLDEEKRRAAQQAQAVLYAEQERRRNNPGTVHVAAVRRNTYDHTLTVVRNMIEIDGQDFGSANAPYKSIKLMPGYHTIRVYTQPASNIYSSNAIQFEVEAEKDIYFLFENKSTYVTAESYTSIKEFTEHLS